MYLAWLGNKASVKQKMQLLRNLLYHFSEDEVRWKEKHRHRKGLYVHTHARVCVLGEEHEFSVFSGLVSFFKVLQYVLLLLCLTVVVVALTVQLQQQMLQTVIQKP